MAFISARSLLRAGTLMIAAQFLMGLIGVGALRLFTELAPATVFGAANLLFTALTLIAQLFIGPFTAVQLRYFSQAGNPAEMAGFKRDVMKLALKSAGLAAVLLVAAVLAVSWAGIMSFAPTMLGAGIVWLFAMTIRNVLMASVQAEFQRLAYAGLLVSEAMLTTVCTAAALWIDASVRSFMIGQALGAVLQAQACWWVAPLPRSTSGWGSAGRDLMAKVLAYGLPFVPINVFGWAANLIDRYCLSYLMGAAATGHYVAPFSIASRGMTMGNTALADLFRPILFDAVNKGEGARVRSTFLAWIGAAMLIGVAGTVFIALFGDILVRTLLAADYRPGAVRIMEWVTAGYAVYGLTQILENRLLSLDHSARLLATNGVGAVCNLLFSVWMIPREGIIGAAHATCASFLAQFLVTFGMLAQALRKSGFKTNLAAPHEVT